MATRPRTSKTSQSTLRGRQVPQKRSPRVLFVLLGSGIALVILAGVGLLLMRSRGGPVAETAPGGPVPTMPSRDHIEEGTIVAYSTNPPTSGEHAAKPATWGIYPSTPPPDERLVHNLEHGGVVMYYNPAKLDLETVEQFKMLTRDLQNDRPCVILTQRTNIPPDKAIALTAWGTLAILEQYDEAAIRAFWRDYVATGPEFPRGQCG